MNKASGLQELSREGFFISPCGRFIPVKGTHIATLIAKPDAFGMTREEIEAAFAAHAETTFVEGKARQQLLRQVLRSGWISVRRSGSRWSVQVDTLDASAESRIQAWARQILKGIGGHIERDRYIDVDLEGLSDNVHQRTSVGELAKRRGKRTPARLNYSTIEDYGGGACDEAG